MARVTGPLFSMSASGTIGKAITFGIWKGINWVRGHVIPANPQTAEQTNVRKALRLCVEYFQDTLTQSQKDAYDVAASGQGYSGYNLYMKHCMDEYIDQLGSSTDPLSVTVVGNTPGETITWAPVV